MIEIILITFLLAYSIRTIKRVFYLVYLWQLKEYRLDRIIAHLQTWQGKELIFNWLSALKWFVLIVNLLFILLAILRIKWETSFLALFLLVWWYLPLALYYFEAIMNISELRKEGWRRPKLTLKSASLVVLAFVLVITLINRYGYDSEALPSMLVFLAVDKVIPAIIFLLVIIFNIPSLIYKEWMVARAKNMIMQKKALISIGVTGSFGKTSTKDFLASILATKFKVLKTEGSQNTEIGVAKTIIDHLKNQEIFVCEMAAYKKGEIKAICDMVKPKIGIITAINEQHLELFGSLENTMKAKFELIEALPRRGLAIFNGDNQYTRQLAEKAKKLGLVVFIYQHLEGDEKRIGQILASNIVVSPKRVEFEVEIGSEREKLVTHLLGAQNVENILAAMVVAHSLGMSLKEIGTAICQLVPPEMTMKPVNGPNGSTLIDDTFNTNPDGIMAAIEYLKAYQGKKILFFQPMIELGSSAERLHQRVGKIAAAVCDQIYLTNKNFTKSFLEGVREVPGSLKKVFNLTAPDVSLPIKENLDSNSVILFEGKEAAKYLQAFLK